ncbi:MAG TPA: FlgD immunoglobulin-like domain containing protein [Rhizomicrobium sp.]|jgi:flagellar basal-body rod modification protein FlgD|nr:FlgD immunoglobulin-like domain containing protein [Rhizomicrobium sp.]
MTTPVTGNNAMSQLSGNFNTFLTLLTSQLKNQDPTSPMDSNAFTQQLVMYSQVEQQIQSNDNLKTLIAQGSSNAATMATSYLGKRVSILNGQASLSGGEANWTYNMSGAATASTLTITDANGKIVYVGDAEKTAGNHQFTWDGKDNIGNALSDGSYKLTVTARDAAGNTVETAVASAGVVSQIDMTASPPKLVLGNMQIDLGDVAAIAN